jgi:hypothetical protein
MQNFGSRESPKPGGITGHSTTLRDATNKIGIIWREAVDIAVGRIE